MLRTLLNRSNKRQTTRRTQKDKFQFSRLEPRRLLAISLGGSISSNTVLADTSEPYCLTADLTVEAGVVLEIRPGVEIQNTNELLDIEVFGSVFATGATLSGTGIDINVQEGGRFNLRNSTVSEGERISFYENSFGVIADSDFGDIILSLGSSDVFVNRNTFTRQSPISANPALVSTLTNNTFAAGSEIWSAGTPLFNANWYPIPNVKFRVATDLTIPTGMRLFITPGTTVSGGGRFITYGALFAYDVNFTQGNDFLAKVEGKIVVRDSDFLIGGEMTFNPDSSGAIAGNRFDQVDLRVFSANVAINNNIFEDTYGVQVRPSILPEFYNNTFTTPDTSIVVGGTLTSSFSWLPIPNVNYGLSSVTVGADYSMAIYAGVEIHSFSQNSRLQIEGTAFAFGVDFFGDYTRIHVRDGGRFSVGNGTSFDGGSFEGFVEYDPGSTGNVVGSSFLQAQLRLNSHAVLLRNNSFTDVEPIRVAADLVPKIYAGQFLNPNSVIEVAGAITSDVSWVPKQNIVEYRLHDDVLVESGGRLTVTNVQVRSEMETDFVIDGTMIAFGSHFVGDNNNETEFLVNAGGQLDLRFDSAVYGDKITYRDGSVGTIDFSILDLNNIEIHDEAIALIRFNSFRNGTLTAVGPSTATIEFKNMYWGTTDLTEIEDRILHQVDNPVRPLVVFQPILNRPPG